MANISTINVKGTSYDIDAVTVNGKTVEKDVPSNAKFTDTTYSAGSGLTLSSTTFNHASSITAGTAGTSSATSGSTVAIPYVKYNNTGHITAAGTHTHTISGFLPLSGGTLTGNLTISKTSPTINLKATDWTITTAANNGLSDTAYAGYINFRGSDDAIIGRVYTFGNTSGQVKTRIQANNKKTDGTSVYNYFDVIVNKDGTVSYACSSSANFRSAMNAQQTLSTTTTTTGTNGFNIRRYGKVVQIQGSGIATNARGTVPSGYRPNATTYIPCIILGTSNDWYFGWLGVTSAGVITVYYLNGTTASTSSASTIKAYVCGTWDID